MVEEFEPIKVKKVWYFGDNINTDDIVPHQFLTENDPDVIVKNAFKTINPEFAANAEENDIIIGGRNFGTGSSREEAVFVLRALGIKAVIAESFARIYYRNLINNGIPAIEMKDARGKIQNLRELTINLKKGAIVGVDSKNEQITVKFSPIPDFIMNILKAGGAISMLKRQLKSIS